MDDTKLSERLKKLGLSEKEIDTYLTILEKGEATASEVSNATEVSKRYVYSISEALEDRGFVHVDDHVVPTEIRARDPSEVIDILTGNLTEIEPALSERHTQTEHEVEQFDVMKSRMTMLKHMGSFISEAENELTLSIAYDLLHEVIDELRGAVDRGVLVMLLVNDVPADKVDDGEFEGVATTARVWDQATPLTLTVDQKYGVVAPSEMVARPNTNRRAISFAEREMVPVITGSFFGNYWPMATQAHVADPRPLPAEFGCFRHAVLDATLHLRNDQPVTAEATVTPHRDSDDRGSVEGTIMGTRQCLVEPATNDFPIENSLIVKSGSRRFSVGGPGALIEDYEAKDTVTLTKA